MFTKSGRRGWRKKRDGDGRQGRYTNKVPGWQVVGKICAMLLVLQTGAAASNVILMCFALFFLFLFLSSDERWLRVCRGMYVASLCPLLPSVCICVFLLPVVSPPGGPDLVAYSCRLMLGVFCLPSFIFPWCSQYFLGTNLFPFRFFIFIFYVCFFFFIIHLPLSWIFLGWKWPKIGIPCPFGAKKRCI